MYNFYIIWIKLDKSNNNYALAQWSNADTKSFYRLYRWFSVSASLYFWLYVFLVNWIMDWYDGAVRCVRYFTRKYLRAARTMFTIVLWKTKKIFVKQWTSPDAVGMITRVKKSPSFNKLGHRLTQTNTPFYCNSGVVYSSIQEKIIFTSTSLSFTAIQLLNTSIIATSIWFSVLLQIQIEVLYFHWVN